VTLLLTLETDELFLLRFIRIVSKTKIIVVLPLVLIHAFVHASTSTSAFTLGAPTFGTFAYTMSFLTRVVTLFAYTTATFADTSAFSANTFALFTHTSAAFTATCTPCPLILVSLLIVAIILISFSTIFGDMSLLLAFETSRHFSLSIRVSNCFVGTVLGHMTYFLTLEACRHLSFSVWIGNCFFCAILGKMTFFLTFVAYKFSLLGLS